MDFILDPSVNYAFPDGGSVTPQIIATRDPLSSDQCPIGYFWFNSLLERVWAQQGFSSGVPQWELISSSGGAIVSIGGTANQVAVSTVAGIATISLVGPYTPATYTLHGVLIGEGAGAIQATAEGATGTLLAGVTGANPAFTGSPSVSGSLTAATTVTATNGNLVGSTAGTGFLFNANAATGAAASPVVLNSRAGQVVFTAVSIAAAADLTLTITNSAITGATTQIIYSMSGSTTGSAPSIKSVTNSAGSSSIVVTNGTGATTTTADIKLAFLVVN